VVLFLAHTQTVDSPFTLITYPIAPLDLGRLVIVAIAPNPDLYYKAGYLIHFVRDELGREVLLGESYVLPINREIALPFLSTTLTSEFLFSPTNYNREVEIQFYLSTMPLFFTADLSGSSTATSSTVNVTTTATQLIPANTPRKGLVLRNSGSGNVGIGFDNTVTLTNNLVVIPKGGTYEFETNYTGAIWMIGSVAQVINVVEFT
jgi:hypothetical protein